VRCNEIQGAQGVENAEATSLASGRNADGSDARYFFADVHQGGLWSPWSSWSTFSVKFEKVWIRMDRSGPGAFRTTLDHALTFS